MGINTVGWRISTCEGIEEGKSIFDREAKRSLVWLEYGEQEGEEEKMRMMLVMCWVHIYVGPWTL